jgi:hypothetical protein
MRKFTFSGRKLRIEEGKVVAFPAKILSVKDKGKFYRVKIDVPGNPDRDAMSLYGVDKDGRKAWQFLRGIFSEGCPVVRLFVNGRRLPEGLTVWPKDIEDGVFGDQRKAVMKEPEDKEDITASCVKGNALVLPGGKRKNLEHKIGQALKLGGRYILLLTPKSRTGLSPYVVCLSRDLEAKWEFRRDKEHLTNMVKPSGGWRGIVRVFSWSELVIDLKIKTGQVDREFYGR